MHPTSSTARPAPHRFLPFGPLGLRIVIVVAAVLAVLTLAAPPPASASTTGVEWSVAPADDAGADGRISLRHSVDPGGSADDAIVVTNLSPAAVTFRVQAGDGVVGSNGAFDIAAPAPDGAGSWIRIAGLDGDAVAGGGALRLGPGEARTLPIRIEVPGDATPGDHPAGIVVGVSTAEGGSTVTNRLGVRVHLRVAGEVTPAVAIEDVTSQFTPSWIPFAPGRLDVSYTVVNDGNVRLGATAGVVATGPLGHSASAQDAIGELLPGDRVTRRASVEIAPLGVITGQVTATPYAVGEDVVPVPAPSIAEFEAVAISWSGLLIVVLLLGGVVTVSLAHRRRRRKVRPDDAEAPANGAADESSRELSLTT